MEISVSQVQVKLQQPPMNKLGAKDIWNVTVRNLSPREVRVYLEGTVDESSDGRIVQGVSGTFALKGNETRRFTANTIPGGGKYSWPNRKYQEVILRTGTAPSGTYTICVYAKNEAGNQLAQDCIQQSIAIMSPPALVSPPDGEIIPEGRAPTFTWLPPAPSPRNARYRLRIAEVFGAQSAGEAIMRNPALLELSDLRMTTLMYPSSARRLEPGKKYAWRIEYSDASSEVWSFTVSSTMNCASLSADFIRTTRGDTCCFQLLMHNNSVAGPGSISPKSFRILFKNDFTSSIVGGTTKGWTRTPDEIPPPTPSVAWTASSGVMPGGKTDFGSICVANAAAETLFVAYEWLDIDDDVICRDSCALPLNKSQYYYELSRDRHIEALDISGGTLRVQYVNRYAPDARAEIRITDLKSQTTVGNQNKKGSGSDRGTEGSRIRAVNGLNRISVNLNDYDLSRDTPYLMTVSNAKSEFYFSFKIKGGHEK